MYTDRITLLALFAPIYNHMYNFVVNNLVLGTKFEKNYTKWTLDDLLIPDQMLIYRKRGRKKIYIKKR